MMIRHFGSCRFSVAILASALWAGACADANDSGGGTSVAGNTAETGGRAGAAATAGTGATSGGAGSPGSAGQGGSASNGGSGGVSGAPGSSGASAAAGTAGAGAGGASGGTTGGSGHAGSDGGKGGSSGGSAGNGAAGGGGGSSKKFVGNITTGGQVRSDFGMYWNQITPENEGKWGSVEGTKDQMNWAGLDRAYNYAKQHNIPFKQHNFVWGSQQPSWIAGLSQSDQRAQVEEWIRLYCARYPDTQLIDVVNEPPPHTTPAYTAALGGAGASGYDWIVQVFKWAHQYCPNSVLIMNDYNNIEYATDNSHNIDIVNRIKAAGAPINAIGAQSHGAYSMSTSTVQTYLDKLASQTGLPVYISEYDINLADDNQQKTVMQSQMTMFWNDSNVKGITVWGYIEGQTWLTNSGLMTSGGQMRPAMTWLTQFLAGK
jgi:endo-1,4-beta-xylanase